MDSCGKYPKQQNIMVVCAKEEANSTASTMGSFSNSWLPDAPFYGKASFWFWKSGLDSQSQILMQNLCIWLRLLVSVGNKAVEERTGLSGSGGCRAVLSSVSGHQNHLAS